jgi:hypothetical protein
LESRISGAGCRGWRSPGRGISRIGASVGRRAGAGPLSMFDEAVEALALLPLPERPFVLAR